MISVQDRITLQDIQFLPLGSVVPIDGFTATVVYKGHPIAKIINDRNSDSTVLHTHKDSEAMLAEAEAYAKDLKFDYLKIGKSIPSGTSLTSLVELIAFTDYIYAKVRKTFVREMAENLLFIRDDQLALLDTPFISIIDWEKYSSDLRAEHGDSIIILAELLADEAFELWFYYTMGGGRGRRPQLH